MCKIAPILCFDSVFQIQSVYLIWTANAGLQLFILESQILFCLFVMIDFGKVIFCWKHLAANHYATQFYIVNCIYKYMWFYKIFYYTFLEIYYEIRYFRIFWIFLKINRFSTKFVKLLQYSTSKNFASTPKRPMRVRPWYIIYLYTFLCTSHSVICYIINIIHALNVEAFYKMQNANTRTHMRIYMYT